jgi:1-deoxy-D-xylulose-5-phosphate synthase
MYAEAGLDADGIVRAALAALGVDNVAAKGRRA